MNSSGKFALTTALLLSDLKTCRNLKWGKIIHAKAVECESDSDMYVANALINTYSKCDSIADARYLFDILQNPNVVTWSTLILGYAENGQGFMSLDFLERMKASGCAPNSVTYMAALKACTSLAVKGDDTCLQRGRNIHSKIGVHLNHHLKNSLIDMYGKCGSMVDAQDVFHGIHQPDVVSWNALLLGYVENGGARSALDMFCRMKELGCRPNDRTYPSVLKACTYLAACGDDTQKANCFEFGRKIHLEIGCHLDQHIQGALIEMYAKCGCMGEARRVFDNIPKPDVVCWTAMLMGYADNGEEHVSLDLFSKMESVCAPNSRTYLAALKACSSMAVKGDSSAKEECLDSGRKIHLKLNGHLDHYVQGALIDMYSKCGSMVEAHEIFDGMRKPDLVAWNALILGYADNGNGHIALDLFSRMKAAGFTPDSVTFIAALKACGLIGALSLARKLHLEISEFSTWVVTCLVDCYAKCGSLEDAREVFKLHRISRDVATWTALLAGHARFGETDYAFSLFKAMQEEGFRPNEVTFVCLLLCCDHAGLVETAKEYIELMPVKYGVTPNVVHYACMVDVLGRGNQLKEAIDMIRRMPCSPNAMIWMTLLGACCKWKNVEIGREAFEALVDIDKNNATPYVLMAQLCGMSEVEKVKNKIKM